MQCTEQSVQSRPSTKHQVQNIKHKTGDKKHESQRSFVTDFKFAVQVRHRMLSKEAYAFVDALLEAGQKYWQILPFILRDRGDSPYQSFSTFAEILILLT